MTDRRKKTASVAEAGTSRASTDCKIVLSDCRDKKTASDKEATKSEVTSSNKNSGDKRNKGVDDSQLTDDGK